MLNKTTQFRLTEMVRTRLFETLFSMALSATFLTPQCDAAWPATDPTNTKGWIVLGELTDEFNGSSLNTSKWLNGHGWWDGRAQGPFAPQAISMTDQYLQINSICHNLVKNYSFEEPASSSPSHLKDWSPSNNSNFIRVADTNPWDGPSALIHRGHYGLKMTGAGEVTQTVTGLSPNTQYRVFAYAHREGSGSGAVKVTDTGTSEVNLNVTATGNYPHGDLLATENPAMLSEEFTTGSGVTSVKLKIINSGTGVLYADSFAITPLKVFSGAFTLKNGEDTTCGSVMSLVKAPAGYYEARIKVAPGCHASGFWFQSGGAYPGCCNYPVGWSEIDVTEAQGGSTTNPELKTKVVTDYHWYPPPTVWSPEIGGSPINVEIGQDITAAFRTYGIEWDMNSIKWYYGTSSTPIRTLTWPGTNPSYPNYPFELDQHLIFTTEPFWYRGVPAYQMNSKMQVDYVRGWKKSLIPGAIYEIFPLHASNLRLNSTGTTNGSNVNVTTDTNANSQRWKAIDVGGGNFEFAPQNAPGQRLDIPGGWDLDGMNVQTFETNGNIAQKWKIESAIPAFGVVEVIPQCAPTKRMEVENAGTSSGSNVRMKLDTSANHQRWVFTRYGQVGF